MNHKKRIALFLILLFAISVFAGLFTSPATAHEHDKNERKHDGHGAGHRLVILHTNDIHGHLVPFKEKRLSKTDKVAGMAYLAAMVEKARKDSGKCVLLLDAGDLAQGTPVSNYFKGIPMIEVMNYMGYDAATIGNHEFDWRQPALKEMIKKAKFPFVCANVVYKDNPNRTIFDLKPYIIKKVGDMNVGILGLTTTETPTITKAENTKGLVFLDPVKTAKKYIPQMRKDGADFIIALTHQGFDEDQKLAKAVQEIDIVIGGHSHTKVMNPKKVGRVLVCQARKYGLYLGKMDLRYCMHSKQFKSFTEKDELVAALHNDIKPDENVVKIIKKYEDEIAPIMKKVVGKTNTDLLKKCSKKSCGDWNMGNMITDGMRAKSGADIAMYNPGGIRSEIYKGEIKAEDVFTVLPFDNWLVTVTLDGNQVKEILEHGASHHGSAQVSGVTFEIDYSQPKGKRVSNIKVNGKPMKMDKDYTLTTIDFLFTGGDGFNFKGAKNVKYGDHVRDVITEYIQKNTPLNVKSDGRIKISGKKETDAH